MIRKAVVTDVKAIHKLITEQAASGSLLGRAMSELYSQVRSFTVDTDDGTGEIIACGALEVIWEDLAEIRSLAVATERQGASIGTAILSSLLNEAKQMGVVRVFVLTYRPSLFERHGFNQIEKSSLPHKIWADCIRCTKFPECDEIALMRDL